MLLPNRDQIQLEEVLSALGHPVRLAIVAALTDGDQHRCGSIVSGVSKSTLTHHWRVLRDAGVIFQEPSGRENLLSLRTDDLDARFPGFLTSVTQAMAEDPSLRASIGDYLDALPPFLSA
ncbi:helix-turn-helix domain-containing protein [Rhodococcus sp. IEGM 1381]|uniref:ArsR/SmtB family transcription factor n=1 Tax=Rhodococcus sp. IEGM 1381 TaxID=3047085 RepID=UPI0024B6F076|nr:helix-turn-helix domain-containing protein [Rhodococcus sp. IEGM 1381]MDI9893330.1 helix-turn-helix domain-containing protein [Rhodococcus sp. IEGM 1381]